jgi:hypothetical protein
MEIDGLEIEALVIDGLQAGVWGLADCRRRWTRVQKKSPLLSKRATEIIPAVTYSPTQLPTQYHRR